MSKFKYNQEEDLNEIRKGFEMFDVENNGKIDPFELKRTMEEMNLEGKNPFIYELISSLCLKKDVKSKGGITSDEFISFLESKISDVESKEGIKRIFNVYSDIDDKIPMPTFYQTARDVGDEEGGVEIKDLVEKSQTGGKEIDFNEFYDIMKEKNPYIKYNQKQYKRRNDYNNSSANSSRSKYKGKNNNEYDVEYEYQYNNNADRPKYRTKYVEKVATEEINDNQVKVDRYSYVTKNGENKEEGKYTYTGNNKRIEKLLDNNNKNEAIEIKRYHRKHKDNTITTTTTITTKKQINNSFNVESSPNMSIYYSKYKKTE
jgi:Ca2+-binding EF-hand superfamily protein